MRSRHRASGSHASTVLHSGAGQGFIALQYCSHLSLSLYLALSLSPWVLAFSFDGILTI